MLVKRESFLLLNGKWGNLIVLHPAWRIYQYLQWLLKVGSHATHVFIKRKIVPMRLKAVFVRVETVPV